MKPRAKEPTVRLLVIHKQKPEMYTVMARSKEYLYVMKISETVK